LTSRSRAYPDGTWRKRHIMKEMSSVLRKAKVTTECAGEIADKLCEYLMVNIDKPEEHFATSDLEHWKGKLKKYAVAETDKARESGFVA